MNSGKRSAVQGLASNRREFILAGASLALLPWLNRCSFAAVDSQPHFAANPFTLGVASGDPSADGAVIWTRLAPSPLAGGGLPAVSYPVQWQVARDDQMQQVVQAGSTLATPQLGHSVHVELAGLEPDRWYWYRFTCGDAVSPVGRTRTAPAANAMPQQLKFAFTSCQHYEQGLYTGYEHMRAEHPDLVLHLGDYIYEYGAKEGGVRKHVGDNEIVSLDDYRNRYAQYRTDPLLAGMHAECPWLIVWDDHEVDNNYANDISEEDTVSAEALLLRRANAYQAFYEHMPLRAESLPYGPNMQLYRRIAFGQLAQFDMLDTRQYRSDQPNGDGAKPLAPGALDPAVTMLGIDQENWLMAGLLNSQATWNVLGQQVMMARVDFKPGAEGLFSMDQWAGYDVARRRLVDFYATRKIPNPIVIAGDIHSNWVNDILADFDKPTGPVVATEFVCTSISSGGNGTQTVPGHAEVLAENPFVRFQNSERGYTMCTVSPTEFRSDYRVVEEVTKPGCPVVTRKSFVVEAGHPGAKLA